MSADGILLERNPSPMKLEVMGVYDWPIWRKEASRFAWTYQQQETCYILRGRFSVSARFDAGPTHVGEARALPYSNESGLLWFFGRVEQKVLSLADVAGKDQAFSPNLQFDKTGSQDMSNGLKPHIDIFEEQSPLAACYFFEAAECPFSVFQVVKRFCRLMFGISFFIGLFSFFLLDLCAVPQNDFCNVKRRRCAVDFAFEARFNQTRQVTCVVEVSMCK